MSRRNDRSGAAVPGRGPKRDLDAEIEEALGDRRLQAALEAATGAVSAERRRAIGGLEDFEGCRDRAREVQERAIARLPELIDTFTDAVRAAGGRVHRATDGAEACRVVAAIAADHGVDRAVKSKSMTSEEIHLNAALVEAGVRVRETDLGEYIVQLSGDRPSHIIAPIIHKTVEDVRRAFREGLDDVDEVPERPEELTQLARERLRQEFLEAEMGITGANFLLADTGTVVLVENEGNVRLCTQLPGVHVVLAGVDKLIPGADELLPFLQLLPRSATGQLQTSYLSFISPPRAGGGDGSAEARSPGARSVRNGPADQRFHVVLLDNGRMAMRDDPVLREALYCIRCGACLNACPPYQAVGGHVYGGETYQSGIGNAWEAGIRGVDAAAEFNELCTTCSRCQDVCPVRIDIPWMNAVLRDRIGARRDDLDADGEPGAVTGGGRAVSTGVGGSPSPSTLERVVYPGLLPVDEDRRVGASERFFARPRRLYRWAAATAPLSRWVLRWGWVRALLERFVGIDRRRPLPLPPRETLARWHASRGGEVVDDAVAAERAVTRGDEPAVALLADCHSGYVDVPVGQAAVRLLERLEVRVLLVDAGCCGRAALSQGLLGTAAGQALELESVAGPLVEAGIPLIVLEPSCATAVTGDAVKLLPGRRGVECLADGSRELLEFLDDDPVRGTLRRRLSEMGSGARLLILHGHCQQKTAGWMEPAVELMETVPGAEVRTTATECCGMAGSFGYKRSFYDISVELGRRLIRELRRLEAGPSEGAGEPRRRPRVNHLACGASCRAQLRDLASIEALHPVQLLDRWTTDGDGGRR